MALPSLAWAQPSLLPLLIECPHLSTLFLVDSGSAENCPPPLHDFCESGLHVPQNMLTSEPP